MAEIRAQTWIDPGTVTLRNAWLERRWLFFPGHTVSLKAGPRNAEWLAEESPEFRLSVNGSAAGPFDLADIEWSDACTPYGAGVAGRYADARLAVRIETFMFHEHPAWLRRMSVMNLASAPATVSRVAVESLPLAQPGLRAHVDQFARGEDRILWRSGESAVAVANAQEGWILGLDQGGAYALFEPQPTLCTLGVDETRTLPAGKTWDLPEAHAFYFTGTLEDALDLPHTAFLETVRNMRQWQQERLRASNDLED